MGIHWLASYPKSGNTWVRAFLSAYKFGRLDINRLGFVSSDNQAHLFQLCCPVPHNEVSMYGWACVRAAMLHALTHTDRSAQLILKTHNCAASIGDMPVIPQALSEKSIYVIRDPRDVAVSYAHHLSVSMDEAVSRMLANNAGVFPQAGKSFVMDVYSSWGMHVKSWTTREFVQVIRYEDFLDTPEIHFRKVLDQYGIEYDQNQFENALALSTFDSLQKAEDEGGFNEKGKRQGRFFRRGKAGAWEDELSEQQVRKIESAFGDQMNYWGYPVEYAEQVA